MAAFRNGVCVNRVRHGKRGKKLAYLRVSAGPQRYQYVATLVLEAKLGRKLLPGYTVDHLNGNTLDLGECGSNLEEVTNAENVRRMNQRRKQKTEETQ